MSNTLPQSAQHTATAGPSPGPSPVGRGVKCEVTPTGLPLGVEGSLSSYAGEFFLSQSTQI